MYDILIDKGAKTICNFIEYLFIRIIHEEKWLQVESNGREINQERDVLNVLEILNDLFAELFRKRPVCCY